MKGFVKFFVSFILFCTTTAYAGDIKAIKTNENFQEVAHIDLLEQIKVNTMPRTSATPKNLRTQYEMRFQGRNTSSGAMTVWSNTFTDYDTKIMESQLIEDEYFIIDNTGKQFKTGNDTSRWCQSNNMYTQNTGNYQYISGTINAALTDETYGSALTNTGVLKSTTLDVKANTFIDRYTFKTR